MRLAELNPAWYHWAHDRGGGAIGVHFDCPVHRGSPQAHRVFVPFRNPIGPAQPEQRRNLWDRTGESFETLTLSPSVDYTRLDNGQAHDASCWHGFIRDGAVS